jgi:phosphoribosylglycinamide formyltransferase-1
MSSGSKLIRISIFSSGNGSNAEALLHHFQNHTHIKVCAVFVNNPLAGVIARTNKFDVPVVLFNKEEWLNGTVLKQLQELKIDYILLAGFFWLVPQNIIQPYHNRILNIHPALLPKYGGKGMYGSRVHQAVLAAGEKESGITIHLINEEYDKGEILFQKTIAVLEHDTAKSIAQRINQLELENYGPVAEAYIMSI